MNEYFIRANSFAAPFFSDESTRFVTADTPQAALEQFAAGYRHPCGLYVAGCWASADAYHKGLPMLARWVSNHAARVEQEEAKLQGSGYLFRGNGPGDFEINGEHIVVENPKAGAVG